MLNNLPSRCLIAFLRVLLAVLMVLPAQPVRAKAPTTAVKATAASASAAPALAFPTGPQGDTLAASASTQVSGPAPSPLAVSASAAPVQPGVPSTFVQVTTDLNYDEAPALVRLANGSLLAAWASLIDGDYEIVTRSSSDEGATWSAAAQMTNDDYPDIDPSLVQAKDGKVWLIYSAYMQDIGYHLVYRASADNGATWSAETFLPVAYGYADSPLIYKTTDGALWVVWSSTHNNPTSDLWYIQSKDNGVTWSAETRLVSGAGDDTSPSLFQAADGKLWLAWVASLSGSVQINARTSTNSGSTWSADTVLVSGPNAGTAPAMAQSGDGKLWLFWSRYTSYGSQILYKTLASGSTTWSAEQAATRFTGYNEHPSPVKLSGGSVAAAFASDRTAVGDIWFAALGTVQDTTPPPHVGALRTSPRHPDASDVFQFQAYVTDETGVSAVSVHWRVNNIPRMDLTLYDDGTHGDAAAGDGWFTNQVGPFPASTMISYQAFASDMDGHTLASPPGDSLYSFQVIEPFVKQNGLLLVLDDQTNQELYWLHDYYGGALDDLGIRYDIWDTGRRGEPSADALLQYKAGAVLWAMPDYGYLVSSAVQQGLVDYLNAGGHLLITGQDIGYYIGGTTLYHDYLHAAYVQDSIGIPTVTGVSGDLIGQGLSFSVNGGANNQAWLDEIDPVAPAAAFLKYTAGSGAGNSGAAVNSGALSASIVQPAPIITTQEKPDRVDQPAYRPAEWQQPAQYQQIPPADPRLPRPPSAVNSSAAAPESSLQAAAAPLSAMSSGTAGVRVDTGTYKVVYLPFGLEGADSFSSREALIERALAWLQSAAPRPVQQLPVNGSSSSAFANSPLSWLAVPGVTSYEIQLDTSDKFNSPVLIDQTVSQTSFTPSSSLAVGWWNWRVRALPGGAWTPTWSFDVLSPGPDMTVVKGRGYSTLKPGEELDYWIYFRNNGSQPASNVQITDTLPEGLSYASYTAQINNVDPTAGQVTFAQNGNRLTWTISSMQPNWGGNISLVTQISAAAQPGSAITNKVESNIVAGETETANNTFALTDTLWAPAPDLSVYQYQSWNSHLVPGHDAQFTIGYSNSGELEAADAVVTMALPEGIAYVSTSGAPAEPTLNNGTLAWAVGTVPAGGYNNFTVTVHVADNVAPGAALTSNYAITTLPEDSHPENNAGSATYSVQAPGPELTVSMNLSDMVPAPVPGRELNYSISYGNNGVLPAAGVQVIDMLPAEMSFVSATVTQNYPDYQALDVQPVIDGKKLTWNLGDLAPGTGGAIALRVKIADDAALGAQVWNRASITQPANDLVPENNEAAQSVTIRAAAPDLFSYIYASNWSIQLVVGNETTFIVSYGNNGELPGSNDVLTVTLPEHVSFASSPDSPVEPVISGSTVTWAVGTLQPGDNKSITLNVKTDAAAQVGSTAALHSAISAAPGETETSNNTAEMTATIQGSGPDLAVNKYLCSSNQEFVAGQQAVYCINYSNNGYQAGTGIQLADTLPPELAYVSSVVYQQTPVYQQVDITPTVSGNTLAWNLGDVAPGDSGIVQVTVQVSASAAAGSQVINTASLTVPPDDIYPNNNTYSSVNTLLAPSTDTYINANVTPGQAVYAGKDFNFWLGFGNNGLLPAAGTAITLTLPQAASFVSSTGSFSANGSNTNLPDPTVSGSTVTWAVGDLPAKASGSVSVTLHLAADTPLGGQIRAEAAITTGPDDSNPSNNAASAVFTVTQARPDMAISAYPSYYNTPYPDASIYYGVTWNNTGQETAKNVQITAALPAGLTYLSYYGYSYSADYTYPSDPVQVNGSQVTWSLGDIQPGWHGELSVQLRVAGDAAPGTALTSRFAIPAVENETAVDNNAAEVTITVLKPTAELQLDVIQSSPFYPGLLGAYRFHIYNSGSGAAQNTQLTQTISGPLTAASAHLFFPSRPELDRDLTPTASGGSLVYDLGLVPASIDGYLLTYLNVDGQAQEGAAVSTTGQVTTTSDETDLNNNAASLSGSVVLPAPDLSLSMDKPGVLAADSEATYRLFYSNAAYTDPAQNTLLVDTMPAGFTFRRATWYKNDYNGQAETIAITPTISGSKLTFDLGTIGGTSGPTASGRIDVVMYVSAASTPPGTPATNRAEIQTPRETNPANNAAERSDTVQQPTRDLAASLYRSGSPVIGQQGVVRVSVSNSGNASVENVTLTYTLPAYTTFVSAVNDQNQPITPTSTQTDGSGRQVLAFNVGTLTGADYALRYTAWIDVTTLLDAVAPEGTQLDHRLDVSGTPADMPNNNSNTATLQEFAQAPLHRLTIEKTLYAYSSLLPGDGVTWYLRISNAGNMPETGITVTDTLPEGMSYSSYRSYLDTTGWQRTVNGNTITWTGPTLPPQGYAYLYPTGDIGGTVPPGTTLTNMAQVVSAAMTTPATTSNGITVVGPHIDVTPLDLDLGTSYPGYPVTGTFTVTNTGAGTLSVTGISAGSPMLSAAPSTFNLSSGSQQRVTVTFTPAQAQPFTGTLAVASNDYDNPTVQVTVHSTAIQPPVVNVNPTSIEASISAGQSQQQALQIRNSGQSDLAYSLTTYPVLASDAKIDALVLGVDPYTSEHENVVQNLIGTGRFNKVDFIDASGRTPTLAELQPYQAVLFFSYTYPQDPAALGNVLADYVDAGGGLVMMEYAWSYGYQLGGRFQTEGYSAIDTSANTQPVNQYYLRLGKVHDASHPVMAGISDFSYASCGSYIPAVPTTGAQVIAEYDNGAALVLEKTVWVNGVDRRRIDLNFVPASDQADACGWKASSQGAQLMANALLYTAAPAFVRIPVHSGTLAPGTSNNAALTMDAAGLTAGTYQAKIALRSNDPANPTVTIPVTMTVGGVPAVALTPTSLDFGEVITGQSSTLNVDVSNPGTADLEITAITSGDPALSAAPGSLRVAPGKHATLAVTYHPSAAAALNANLTLDTNDPANPQATIHAVGQGVLPPVVGVTPGAVTETLASGAAKDVPVTIRNTGASKLTWSLTGASPALPGGYTLASSKDAGGPNFQWVDIAGSGTKVDMNADWAYYGLPIGFDFPFYGQTYSTFVFSRFGYIGFGDASGYYRYNEPIPTPGQPDNIIAVLWDQLYQNTGAAYYQTIGDTLVVQWQDYAWEYIYPYNQTFTAQAILRKNGEITLQYKAFSANAPLTGLTVGIENADGTRGVQAVSNGPLLEAGLALRFTPSSSWYSAAPQSGTTLAGASSTVTVHLDASGLPAGSHTGKVTVESNDPSNPKVDLPVTLTVTGQPKISGLPAALDFGRVFVGASGSRTLVVQNSGAAPLTVSAVSSNSAAVKASPSSFSVPAFGWQPVTVTYTPTAVETLSAALTIASSDPSAAQSTVALTGSAAGMPAAAISPASVTANVNTGKVETRAVTLANSGQGALAFSVRYDAGSPFTVSPASGTVAAGASTDITVSFDTTRLQPGAYTGAFTITTDDPSHPTFTIPVTLNVILGQPETPTNPNPAADAVDANMSQGLFWEASYHASYYSLYLWRDGETKPSTPTAGPLYNGYYYAPSYRPDKPLDTGTTYHWQVVAVNVMGSVPGPEWTFTTEKLPELQVISAMPPARAYSGMPVEFSWVVKNTGDLGTGSSGWYEYLYLSQSPIFSYDGLVYLGNVQNASYLNPGESYQNTATFTLPNGLSGNYYLYVTTDYYGYLREANEGNNTTRSGASFVVSLTPPPDLQVTAVSGPANVFSGVAIRANWTVKNAGQGGTVAADWYDDVYLSADAIFNRDQDTFLGRARHTGALAAGESYSAAADVTIPYTYHGDYYLFVVTDAYNGVFEYSNEGNNTSPASAAVHVTLTPPPDLEVTSLAVPPSAYSGDAIDVTYVVTNNGLGEPFEQSWQDTIYLSTSATFDKASATVLGNYGYYGDLPAGSSYTVNETYTLPQGISGTYYVHVVTDSANKVFEYDYENNNTRASAPLAVTLSASPDLTVSAVTAPGSTTGGAAISVSWTVANLREPTGSKTWSDAVYLATSPSGGNAIYLGLYPNPNALDTNASYIQTRSVVLPAYLSSGTYYLLARTDYLDEIYEHQAETNNAGASQPIQVTALPQLGPTDLALSDLTAPAQGQSGQPVTVGWKVTNAGKNPTQASSWTDVVYLSADNVLNPGSDALVGRFDHAGALQPGESYTQSQPVTLPDGIEGQFTVFVVVDTNLSVKDSDRSNNTAYSASPLTVTLAPAPDLAVSPVAPASAALAGQPLEVKWQVTNQGAADTTRAWFDAVYLSSDMALDVSDLQLGSAYTADGLAVGASYQRAVTVNIPSNASGTYYLLVKTDSRGEVYEHGAEDNNLAAWAITLTVPPPADLVVEQVLGPATAAPGEPVAVQWTLRNQGQWAAAGHLCDAVFVSADAAWDINDPKLGSQCYTINLAAGASSVNRVQMAMPESAVLNAAQSFSGTMPGVTPGAYHIIVRADILNAIPEADDANNTGVSTSTTMVDVTALELGKPASGSIASGQGRFYRVDVPAGETLLVALKSENAAAVNELYARYGQTPTRGAFDYMFSDPLKADQEVVVPLTEAGSYYIYLYAANGGAQTYTITASLLTFELRGFQPQQGGQGQVTVTISGAKMTPNTTAWLESGTTKIPAQAFSWVSASRAFATFDLSGAALGTYDLVIVENGARAVGAQKFEVVPAVPGALKVTLALPSTVRPGSNGLFTVNYANNGNTDVVAPVLKVVDDQAEVRLLSDVAFTGSELKLFAANPSGPVGVFPPGAAGKTDMIFRPLITGGTVTVHVYRQNTASQSGGAAPAANALSVKEMAAADNLPSAEQYQPSAEYLPLAAEIPTAGMLAEVSAQKVIPAVQPAPDQPRSAPALDGAMLFDMTNADTAKIWEVIQQRQSPLMRYQAEVLGETVRADQIIMMAATNPNWEINPGVLLAYLDWKFNLLAPAELTPAQIDQRVVISSEAKPGLFWQLSWLAEQLAMGYAGGTQALNTHLAAFSQDQQASGSLAAAYEGMFGAVNPKGGEIFPLDWRPVFSPPLSGEMRVTSFFDFASGDGKYLTRLDGRKLPSTPLTLGYNSFEDSAGYEFDTSDTQSTTVYAAGSGRITYAGQEACTYNGQQRANYKLVIEHPNGLRTEYRHIDGIINNPRTGQPWKAGDEVVQNDIIGAIGTQGWKTQCSSNTHLDFRVQVASGLQQYVDPFGWWGDTNAQERQPLFNAPRTVSEQGPGFQKFGLGDWPNAPRGDGGHAYYIMSRSALSGGRPDYRNWAIWWANIPSMGEYEVQAFIPEGAEASNVEYRVLSQDGISRVTQSQAGSAGQWLTLGKFNFTEGGPAAVMLTDYIANTNGRKIYFDTVRWVAPGEEGWEPLPSDTSDANGTTAVVAPKDPNDILGPAGYGDSRWVPAADRMDYTIRFENDPALATAPAQKVVIEQVLDDTLDVRKFRLGPFGFASHIFQGPDNKPAYQERLGPVDVNGVSLYVDVSAGIDVTTRKAFWILQAIDPATGAPPSDPMVGFLLPDINNGEGQGFVTYSIQPAASAATGARVDALARIVFDNNDPIDTPAIFNTLDAAAPVSKLAALPAQTIGDQVLLTWTGADDAGGSGIKDYRLYVSEDNGPFSPAAEAISGNSYIFTGQLGHHYGFFVAASDNAGNVEAAKGAAEASTLIYLANVPSNAALTASPAVLTADGASQSILTALVTDGLGAPQANVVVQFETTRGTLTPAAATTNASGEAKVTLTAASEWGPATITAKVGKISATAQVDMNDLPAALGDAYDATEDTTLTVDAPGVLENDTDAYGSSLTAALVDAPATGTLTLNLDGSFTYQPASNANGPVSFTYQASDGFATTQPVTVTITVAAVNDPPTVVDDGLVIANGQEALKPVPVNVLANDSTPELGETLAVTAVSQPAHGVAAVGQAGANVLYTPAPGYIGEDSFTYTVSDGNNGEATGTVYVTTVPMDSVILDAQLGAPLTLTYTDRTNPPTTLDLPANAVTEPVTLVFTPLHTVTAPGGLAFANHAFDVQVYKTGRAAAGYPFNAPVTVTVGYTNADIQSVTESMLSVMRWDGSAWAPGPQRALDAEKNTLTFAITTTGRWALFGSRSSYPVYLPLSLRP